ncbi:hemin ABC transporter substrate-binding protein [Embleya sp. NBC_00896]|uniref:heme/hemin ABC transporter substrate-binding protein n=1 Tax=Embleya sp. NBC_00896 TaxID=2975961 RepID=UPI00386FBF75|nr:ABC transporter substrate-binding protein [Embleya sp. NBC_00896]
MAAAVLAVTAFAAACGDDDKKSDTGTAKAASSAALPVTVDTTRGKVTVKDASRIVPLGGDIAQSIYALGLAENVVGVDASGAVLPESKGKPTFGNSRALNPEGILAQRPTVAIGSASVGPRTAIDQLKAAGVAVVLIPDSSKPEDAVTRIQAIATALGVPEKGKTMADRTAGEIAAAKAKGAQAATKPRVAFLYIRGQANLYHLGGKGLGPDSMITAAGGIDTGTELGIEMSAAMTPESMVAAKPDVILVFRKGLDSVGGVDGVLKLPGVAQTPAGQNKKVVAMDDLELGGGGPTAGIALDQLVTLLHS